MTHIIVTTTKPGDLVVSRVRFALHSRQVGIVVGGFEPTKPVLWLVMWVDEGRVKFSWHVDDALLVVDDTNMHNVEERRFVA